MIALAMKNIEKYYGANLILKDLDMELNEGEKTALIGRNGCGKTTLLKLAAGLEKPDKGMVMLRKNMKVGYLEQSMACYGSLTVYEVLLQGRMEVVALKREMESLEQALAAEKDEMALYRLAEQHGKLRDRFELLDGYQLEMKVTWIAGGLQLSPEMYAVHFESLSGGEKTRVLLAKLLLAEPELLLLDEPTNHLDIKAIEWLEDFVRSYKGTVLIISHDRYFLDTVVKRVIEMEDGACQSYEGNYSWYMQEKERRLLEEFANFQDQQKEIRRMEEAVKRLRDWGNRGDNEKFFRKAASIEKAIDRMEKIKRPVMERKRAALDFEAYGRGSKDVIVGEGLSKGYGSRILFQEAALHIRYGEKVGLIGANGSGKTTLLRMVLKEEAADGGTILTGPGVKAGYLAQAVRFEDESRTILEEFSQRLVLSEGEARGILARFLFYKDSVFKRLRDLSGGERTRLLLAMLMHQDVNLLILDEPTNHLDIDTREVLEDALEAFEGTLFFISHDRYFINKLADRLYHIESEKLVEYCGDYDYFKEKYRMPQPEDRSVKAKVPVERVKKPAKDAGAKTGDARTVLAKGIDALEKEIEAIQIEMNAAPNRSDYAYLNELSQRLQLCEQQLEAAYAEWYAQPENQNQ